MRALMPTDVVWYVAPVAGTEIYSTITDIVHGRAASLGCEHDTAVRGDDLVIADRDGNCCYGTAVVCQCINGTAVAACNDIVLARL